MLPQLDIRLLGPFQARLRGETVSGFDSDKVRALLAYLSVEAGRPVRREKLAGLLWPDFAEASARTNLRQALANLRRVLDDPGADLPFLLPTHQAITFNSSSPYTLDVALFNDLVTGQPGRAPSILDLEKAVGLYQGEFLQGFSLPDAATFEEWALVTRESLERQAVRALYLLAEHYQKLAAYEQALRYAYRQLELDPFQEAAHHQVLGLLAQSGQRNEALAHYEAYCQLLQAELGVEPLDHIQELYHQLQAGEAIEPRTGSVPPHREFPKVLREEPEAEGLPFAVPPGGTVTFLFTDIAGATRLLQDLGEKYRTVLADQRRILRETVGRWHGYEVDTQGDAFFFAFPRASEAVAAAVEAQRQLAGHRWPEGGQVRVRMGLHTGEPWLADEGYVGIDVHRAARIAQIGHGGQVLLSETTAALVMDELPDKVQLQDLGHHALKDIPRPERIRQLLMDGLPGEFPALESTRELPPGELVPVEAVRIPSFVTEAIEAEEPALFVGRTRQMARLEELLDQALAGQGGFAFITGSSGRGKTALMKEFANRAMAVHPDLLVSAGECNAYTGVGDPYLPFRQTVNLLCGDLEPRWKERAITREQARRLWEAFPDAARSLVDHGQDLVDAFVSGERLLTRAAMAVPADTELLQAIKRLARREPGTTGKLEQKALHEQYTHFLTTFVEQRPVLILLDDLQWADEASISLLFHLGRHLVAGRILILGAYRAEDVGQDRHPMSKLLAEFKTRHGDIWIDLSDTEATEDRQFVQAYLDSAPNRFSPPFRESFYQHTAGHPLFCIELWRDLEARAGIVQGEDGFWAEGEVLSWDSLPARVEGVIEDRLARLHRDLRELLTAAAVEGEQFSAQVLARVLAMDEERVIDMLVDELGANHKLIVEQGPYSLRGQRIYRFKFRHMLYPQYLYANLSPIKRERLHFQVGEALEVLYREEREDVAPQLVRHFDQVGDDLRVMEYAFLAGERAWRLGASTEAVHFYELSLKRAGISQPSEPPVPVKTILERLGDVYLQNLSRQDEALDAYKDFLDLAESAEEKIRGRRKIASIYLLKGQDEQAREYYARAMEGLDPETATRDASLIHTDLAFMAIYENDLEAATAAAQTALDIATRLGFSHGEAQAHNALGHIDTYRGDLEDAREHFAASLEIYRSAEDHPRMAKMYNNLGEITRMLGKMEAAQDYLQQGLAIARRVGDRREEAAILTTSGDILLDQGRWDEAVSVLEEALPVAEMSGVTVRRIEVQWFLGAAYLRLGKFQEARKCLQEVEKRCQETNYLRYLPGIFLELARLEVDEAEYKAAKRYIQLAEEAAGEEAGDELLGQFQHLHGSICAARQQWDEALARYGQARKLFENAGSPVKIAEAHLDLGLAYLNRAQPGDGQLAREHFVAAREVYQGIGADPLVSTIEGYLEEV